MLLALLGSSIQHLDKGHLECRVIEDKSLLVQIASLLWHHTEAAVPIAAARPVKMQPHQGAS